MNEFEIEVRYAPTELIDMTVERSEEGGAKAKGYAAVFNSRSLLMSDARIGRFYEEIKPGAFRKTIQEMDQLALYAHDGNALLGRRSSGTLRMWEDQRGLAFELDLPDTPTGQEVAGLMERGDLRSCSFGFSVVSDDVDLSEDVPVRRISELRCHEISIVANAAYPATEVALRSIEAAQAAQAEAEPRTADDMFAPSEAMVDAVADAEGVYADAIRSGELTFKQVERVAAWHRRHEGNEAADAARAAWGGPEAREWAEGIITEVLGEAAEQRFHDLDELYVVLADKLGPLD